MGIKNFHKWTKAEYPSSFKNKWLDIYDHVYIDINYVLHHCSYGIKNKNDIYNKIYQFIDNILLITQPYKTVVICGDGPAALAKLVLQRKRRLIQSESDDISIMFSPGTEFMISLQDKMESYILKIKNIYNINVIVDITNADEAELKIKQYIMNLTKDNIDLTHIVITNDADVFIMLMMLDNMTNVYIYEINFQNSDIISLGHLLVKHIEKVGCSKYPHLDFSAINILLGNDYLPKINFLTFEKIWQTYHEILQFDNVGLICSKDLQFNINFMHKLLLGCINKTKKNIMNLITIENINHPLYSNYIDGYTWCLFTYNTGKCIRYNYMYEYNMLPHPFGIIFNILNTGITINPEIYPPINTILYLMLILPKKYKNYIHDDYIKFYDTISLSINIKLNHINDIVGKFNCYSIN